MVETLNRRFILSDPLSKITDMHHPWRRLRDHLPDWQVKFTPRPPGKIGGTDAIHRTIYLEPGMLQVQRRTVLDHELYHAENGDIGCQHPHRERHINEESARRLLPIECLLNVVVWANGLYEMADGCFVDVATMRCRLDHLHPTELAAIRRAIATRDFHEEGWT